MRVRAAPSRGARIGRCDIAAAKPLLKPAPRTAVTTMCIAGFGNSAIPAER